MPGRRGWTRVEIPVKEFSFFRINCAYGEVCQERNGNFQQKHVYIYLPRLFREPVVNGGYRSICSWRGRAASEATLFTRRSTVAHHTKFLRVLIFVTAIPLAINTKFDTPQNFLYIRVHLLNPNSTSTFSSSFSMFAD